MYHSTPVHLAAEKGYSELIDLLANCGGDVNRKNLNNLTPLSCAFLHNHCDAALALINNYADLSDVTLPILHPLHIAVAYNHFQLTSAILKSHKIHVDSKDHKKRTCLQIAFDNCYFIIATLLLESKADHRLLNCEPSKALHIAAANDQVSMAIELIKQGASVNVLNDEGVPPIYLAIQNGHTDAFLLLKDSGADLSWCFRDGCTLLHYSIKFAQFDMTLNLINSGAEVNAVSNLGDCPIHLAAEKGNLDVILSLIDHGANIEALGRNKDVPLHIAIDFGHIDAAAIFIRKNANVFAHDVYNKCLQPLILPHNRGVKIKSIDVISSVASSGISTLPTNFLIGNNTLDYHVETDGEHSLHLFVMELPLRNETSHEIESKYELICESLASASLNCKYLVHFHIFNAKDYNI